LRGNIFGDPSPTCFIYAEPLEDKQSLTEIEKHIADAGHAFAD